MMDPQTKAAFDKLPKLPQRQDSLNAQLTTLIQFANRIGCYDAADHLASRRRHEVDSA